MNLSQTGNSSGGAQFVITFDLELAWGAVARDRWQAREEAGAYARVREILHRLLDEMDSLEIPATWAAVGAMLDRPGDHQLDHLPAPLKEKIGMALDQGREESFYGADIVSMIASRRVKHRFASHTYSHLRTGYPGVTSEIFRKDLEIFFERFPKELNLVPKLVFPENQENFLDAVKDAGITKVRACDEGRANNRSLSGILEAVLYKPSCARSDITTNGLHRETASFLYSTRRRATLPLLNLRLSRGLSQAIATGGRFHLWNHPYDLGLFPPSVDKYISGLRKVARLRDAGKIEVTYF